MNRRGIRTTLEVHWGQGGGQCRASGEIGVAPPLAEHRGWGSDWTGIMMSTTPFRNDASGPQIDPTGSTYSGNVPKFDQHGRHRLRGVEPSARSRALVSAIATAPTFGWRRVSSPDGRSLGHAAAIPAGARHSAGRMTTHCSQGSSVRLPPPFPLAVCAGGVPITSSWLPSDRQPLLSDRQRLSESCLRPASAAPWPAALRCQPTCRLPAGSCR
jgi:hypothetical protein